MADEALRNAPKASRTASPPAFTALLGLRIGKVIKVIGRRRFFIALVILVHGRQHAGSRRGAASAGGLLGSGDASSSGGGGSGHRCWIAGARVALALAQELVEIAQVRQIAQIGRIAQRLREQIVARLEAGPARWGGDGLPAGNGRPLCRHFLELLVDKDLGLLWLAIE